MAIQLLPELSKAILHLDQAKKYVMFGGRDMTQHFGSLNPAKRDSARANFKEAISQIREAKKNEKKISEYAIKLDQFYAQHGYLLKLDKAHKKKEKKEVEKIIELSKKIKGLNNKLIKKIKQLEELSEDTENIAKASELMKVIEKRFKTLIKIFDNTKLVLNRLNYWIQQFIVAARQMKAAK